MRLKIDGAALDASAQHERAVLLERRERDESMSAQRHW